MSQSLPAASGRTRKLFGVAIALTGWLFASQTALAATTVTFNATGAAQTWTVPAGVTSVQIDAKGAQGYSGRGGLGGHSTGTLAVTPGEVLQINVGGQGVGAAAGTAGGGGFNGGGHGRSAGGNIMGGGGGATDVRQGGTAVTDRKIVAGGGGGGDNSLNKNGGGGGGLAGGDGETGSVTGGTQAAGGTGGSAGSLFSGGSGASASEWAPGGGGGYYGGGASNWNPAGGGSGYIGGVTVGTTTASVRSGDGVVVLTFTEPPAPVPTLSEWALILFGVILAGGTALTLQRRAARF